ncbi:HTTM domain-containing protein [Sphingomonas bacterium]|uniref:HTTM domain-containing protein n=1 Tax=Sphingomonas bacterium TaxID=1895847 RepID=UPI00261BC32F|nr:HTTM domain-containing protein [Sphingomonas bacterium]MDB5678816.1 hypothetical protein [Sphingomonas bacterium]
MTAQLLADATTALPAMRLLIAAWMLLAAAQWLTSAGLFAPDGLLPWPALAAQRGRPWIGRVRRRMSVGVLRTILVIQLIAAITLAVGESPDATIVCLTVLIASHAGLIMLSGEFWADGAAKMGMIAMAGALIVAIGVRGHDPAMALAGVIVAGGQLTLSYAVAGFSKLAIRTWRDGSELQGAMAAEAWGHPLVAQLTRHRPVALAASWGVMLLEAAFPLALLAPTPWLVAALGLMLLFHFATAVMMGLNLFPWAFAAAYPAVIVLGRTMHAAL